MAHWKSVVVLGTNVQGMVLSHQNSIKKLEQEFKSYLKRILSNSQSGRGYTNLSYDQFFSNRMLVVTAIREGITLSFFMSIQNLTPFSETDWSNFLNISQKSLQRYKKDKTHVFKPIHSEKIMELAEVTALGNNVFDSSNQFYEWLNTPSLVLGKMKPVELLNDSYGKEMVMNELNRIDQGIFA